MSRWPASIWRCCPARAPPGQFDLASTAIGTGPFILQKWDRKVAKTYVKNPDYFIAGKPHVDQVNLVIQADPASAIAAFRTNQLDATGSVSDTLLPSLISTNPSAAVRVLLAPGPNQITFNQAKTPFGDYRVRKAVAMAWDRDGMSNTFYPKGYAISGPYPSSLTGGLSQDDAKKDIPYDPAAAKKLLADAGYPNGFDVEMLTTDGYGPAVTNQAQWVQEDLKKIGINVTLRILDYASYFTAFQSKDYVMSYGLSTGFLSPDEWLQALYKTNGPRNWFNSGDATLDGMIDAQRGETDADKRETDLKNINQYIEDNVLNPFLGSQYSSLLVTQPYVHNMYTHPEYGRAYMADVWLDKNAPGRKS